ncbi:copper homeostasis protein CutC [Stenotrophomonas sp. 24(2023)]|uniref:copper homeostasis protein CutC n=1 Tax=Stenotrophomonas sp. 24(2023) TaxID=3068324 RepID=UPI0027DFC8D0|nr:copper homeostasis protein CutC [Stenotrophomonas sp. 24(2023)]WMJ69009.1 copper homeostasis protein CutC [Stenotrophomonas sp. 24(2023)]
MNTPRTLEIASNSVASALAAQAGGADRIELFDNLAEGGTTPSHASIAVARERLRIPLFVLVRPRPGDFHYDALEAELMLRDIAQCRALGCDGVVIGALDAHGGIDLPLCRELVQAAGPLQVTFHRAFDATRDLPTALEQVIGLGCQRVLSSGGRASAEAGSEVLAGLVKQSAGRIQVMAGAGLGPANVASVARRTGCQELHASAKAPRHSAMAFHNPALTGLDPHWSQSDTAVVARLRQALDAMA